jgi:hypothetical protein
MTREAWCTAGRACGAAGRRGLLRRCGARLQLQAATPPVTPWTPREYAPMNRAQIPGT